ncbi:MAG TPA: lysozyme inhibitor LprI family protein [Dongiaceae bacterium]|nr:lysozyme inhibitor LprI family protein [Dongiaceae bacterium]
MKQFFFAAALVVCGSMAGSLSAKADCEHTKNDFDDVYCLSKNYINADADLNQDYAALAKQLDAEGKASLKKGQLAWMDKRNNSCGFAKDDGYYVDLDCAVSTTRARTRFLKDRLDECKAGGCQKDKLDGE